MSEHWIKVENAMPEPGVEVDVWRVNPRNQSEGWRVASVMWSGQRWMRHGGPILALADELPVTHWRPAPKSPTQEEAERHE